MKKYKVTGPHCRVGAGCMVMLNQDQYRRRCHRLEDVKGDAKKGYTAKTKESFEFKKGEVFGYDGPPDKHFMSNVEELEGASKKPKSDDKPQADAKPKTSLSDRMLGRG